MVTKLENLLEGWIAQQETTAEALRTATADQLSAFQLDCIEGTVDGPFSRPIAGDPVAYEKLRLSLRFKATDGTKALCRD